MKTKAVALMFLAKIARNVACLSAFFVLSASAATVAKVGETGYESLEAAIQAATPDANGVIEYQILGKAEVSASDWVQVVKVGLSGVSKVAFVGKTADAEICITEGVAILADQKYDLDVSFENLTLSKQNPTHAGDYGHGTEYFTTWLRNTGAAENTVTYTNCKFPNGVCNNQYGKTIFENCTFANAATDSYNMWVYGGAVEMRGCAFGGTRGVKVYTEGTPDTAPTVDVKATSFTGLSEKAAIVVSKAATVALKDVSVTDCARGTFQKAIGDASENVTLAANGTGLAGTFAITAEKDLASAKTEFNVSAGTFTAEVSADYCAEGFTVKATTDASGNTVYGVEAADPRTLGYATSGAAAALPAVPDMGGTVVNVTAAQAQYVLDGAYGSIDGKTINFTESVADTLVLGRASKYAGSGTLYRHGSHDGEAMSYEDFIAYKNQATWTEGCYYERTVENVTFTADAGVIVNFTAEGGAHIYGTESAPVYDYVRDTGTWTHDTNNGFYKRVILKNITFQGLTFKAKTDFNTSEATTVFDGFTFTGCTFEIGSTAAGNYALRYYNENNNGSVRNLVVANCTFKNCYQGVYTHHVKGITVKDCLFDTTGHNAIAIQSQGGEKGACDHGAVVITGNTFKNIGDRIIRFNEVGTGTTITIVGNTADGNSGKKVSTDKREIVKAESLPENASEIITASNNDWGANAVVEDVFADAKPVAATIGAVSYETLDAALSAVQDGETIVVNAGEYKLTGSQSAYSGKAFTVKAAENAAVSFDMSAAVTLGGAKITFEGVTFDYKTNSNYIGLQHADTLVYNDCTINGVVFLYAASETFNRCTFNQSSGGAYNVWTYGAKKVAFNACTFNCAGKSVLVYNEGATEKTDLTVASCTFNASAGVEGKAAIEIDTSLMKDGASVAIDGETKATGFAEGSNSGSTLWNDKKQTKDTNKNVTVTVAGETVFAPVVATIGETGYASLADALAAVKDGETVTLIADVTEDVTIDKSITLDLGGKTLTNAGAGKVTLTIAEGATVIVKNGGIVGGASNYAIQNNGMATFEDVTATAGNVGSSMLDNFGTLTINSGTYVGGMNTVKNEPKATLTVNGGRFENSYGENSAHTGVIYNLGHVAITGGELTQKATGPVWAGPHVVMTDWDKSNKPSVTITGGTFTSVWTSSRATVIHDAGGGTAGCTIVSGGTFNKKVPEDYCAAGFIPTANDDGTYGVKEGAYVAAIGAAKYETVDAAIAAAKDGDTVKMLADVNNADYTVANVIDVSLASGVTLDGNGKTLSGNVKVTVASAGGVTIKNVLFKDIHNAAVVSADAKEKYGFGDAKVGTLSAVYAPKLAGSLTVTGCTFENCDWEALQITPAEGAKIDIRENVFKTSASDLVTEQLRHLHIEMAYGKGFDYAGTDIAIMVTDNQFLGGAKTAAGIWWVGEASVLALSGNYYAEPDTVSITLSDGKNRTNRCDLIYPARSQADVDVDDLMASALVVHDDFNASAYSTLAEAIAAAKNGETVKLLADANGDGIRVPENAFPTGLVVDFAGHTYTVGGLLVGSSATKSNGFQLLKGNKITFKNGTLVGATATAGEGTDWTGAPAILIQNYCDLTLEKMTVKGGDETCYTLSNNNGDIVIADSTIVAGKGTKGPFAFDVCRFSTYPKVHVTVTGDSVIDGDVEVSGTVDDGQSRQLDIAGGTFKGTFSVVDKPANIAISGGTFSTAVLPDYCAAGFIPTANDDGTYGVKEGAYVAAIGEVKYETLAEAFDAAKKGDTVTLLADITLTEQVNITKALDGLTLDGNNKTITCATTTDPLQSGGSALYFGNENDKLYCTGIAIKDLTMTGTARFAIFLCGGTSTTFTNVKISGHYYIAVNLYGTHGATMTDCEISNSTTGTDKYISAIWSNVASVNPLTLNNTTVNVIAINEYTKDNELKPKICVNEGSTVGEIHTFDYGEISGDTRLCVGASPVMPSVKTWDTNTETWIVAPDEVVVNALIGGGRVTLPASLLAQVPGTTRFDRFSKLKEPDANGNLAWVNLVAGIDPAKKVTMTAPQNGKPGVIDVKLSAVSEPPSGTDVTVAYEIVKDGSETVDASATAADSLALTLDGTAGIGVYRAVLSLRQNGSEVVVARVESANALGVLQTVREAKKTIIAVPWLSLTDGNAIAVADLVKTAGLTKGDELHVYNKTEDRYDVYELTADKAWAPKAIYKVGADGTVATASSGTPETTVARGSGVWIERQDTTQPIVSYGAVASATVATTLDAGTKEKPTWHLLAVPTTTAVNLVATFGMSETDTLIVPTDGAPKICTVNDGTWGYEKSVPVTDESGNKLGVKVVRENVTELPAGTGFWYLNGGAAKTVNW